MADVGAAVRRLAVREYAPWLGLILTWVIVALAVGHADAARLIAAWAFVRCARYLTGANAMIALRKRRNPDGAFRPGAVRVVLAVTLVTLFAAFALVLLTAVLLRAAGQEKVAELCLLLSIALPPRYLLPFTAKRRVLLVFRMILSWVAVPMMLLAWLFDASLTWVALTFAAREWLAMGLAFAIAPKAPAIRRPYPDLHWREIAARTATLGRRRLSYRLGKGLLSIVLGPMGGFAARTGRGLRLHHRTQRFTPQNPVPLLLLALSTAGSAAAIVIIKATPATLIASASLLMVGSVAANVLIWGWLGGGDYVAPSEDEDDDD